MKITIGETEIQSECPVGVQMTQYDYTMTNKKTYYRAEVIDGKPVITPVELSYRAASSRKQKKGVQIFDDEKGAAVWLVTVTHEAYTLANELLYKTVKASLLKTPPA